MGKLEGLRVALDKNDSDKVVELLESKMKLDDLTEVLFWAVKNGNVKVIKKLLNIGVDIDVQMNAESILHVAVRNHNTEMIEFLVQKTPIDWGLRDMNGMTALNLACANGDYGAIKSLLHKGKNIIPIRYLHKAFKV